jgi:hypothetical protein
MDEFEKALNKMSEQYSIGDTNCPEYTAMQKGARWAREWLATKESFEALVEIMKLRTENAKLRGALEKVLQGELVGTQEMILAVLKETGGDDE